MKVQHLSEGSRDAGMVIMVRGLTKLAKLLEPLLSPAHMALGWDWVVEIRQIPSRRFGESWRCSSFPLLGGLDWLFGGSGWSPIYHL